ncbi:hypothetical protein F511_37113 [Dorcoceras hygrometricum]|uniref:ARM repeat N-terminal plant domain-containing protein n=1 Tax=Dorcoceras hygrometricum TaxID=472368 RepID=A0A2Z7CBH0_9LAMI|nr:hypothetical protein F511_37113 [Dorcoceras hygrometricum]
MMSMDKLSSDCPYPGCFFCVMKEGNPNKRKASILKFFRELPSQDDDGQVLPISGLWNTAMAHPNDPEFIELGIFECMAALIWKGLNNRRWLSHDQNIYIPYYAAHIIGSYTMNMEEFAETSVHAGVIPALVELLRGRLTWVEQRVAVRALGHLATYASTFSAISSQDDWQYMAIDCLLWLLQDPNTCHKVMDKAVPTLIDLAEITSLGEHKKLGDSIVNVLRECIQSSGTGRSSVSSRAKEQVDELLDSRQKLKWEKNMAKEDLHIKQAAALVVKLEGNSLFSAGDISGAASKYSEALSLCPMRSKKERVVLYSNRAQCHLLLQQPLAAISDATRALCLNNPVNRHAKSLWRRAQAYDMLGFSKESLLDAIMFVNECSQSSDPDLSLRQNKVPDYAERLVKKQMRAAWLFREAAIKHGGVHCEGDAGDLCGRESDDSEWETASESDIGNDGKDELGDDDRGWKNELARKHRHHKASTKGGTSRCRNMKLENEMGTEIFT